MVPALFSTSSDDLLRAALLAAAAVVVGAPLLLLVGVRSPTATGAQAQVVQPVLFDHRHHVRDDGIDCLFCHNGATRGPRATVPATSVCLGCHAQIWVDSPLLAPLRESAATRRPIPWVRVSDVPDFAFFDHRAHTLRGVGCVECHGRVDLMPQVVSVQPVTMAFCLDCHRDPTPHLRPLSRITDMEWRPSDDERAAAAASLRVRPPLDCVGCHR